MSDVGGGRPVVWGTSLFSQLLTRHTGRAVRLSIENQISECDERVVAVLDFRNVVVIDFSCADEVVAKLAMAALFGRSRPHDLFLLFRGVDDHHLDPIRCALDRRSLSVAAERRSGEPLLLGPARRDLELTWRALCGLGRATAAGVAPALDISEAEAGERLEDLHVRRLAYRDGTEYVSLQRLIREASPNPFTG